MLSPERHSARPASAAWLFLSVSRVTSYDVPLVEQWLIFTAVFVGTAREWIPELIERAKALKVSGGFEEHTDMCVASLLRFLRTSAVRQPQAGCYRKQTFR
jgi:hypothetical protein